MTASSYFSENYATARARLLEAAASASGCHEAFPAADLGALGEAMAMDVVCAGSPDAEQALLITSGCHGVEGHAGSAAQIGALLDRGLLDSLEKAGIALLVVHALNPHGFSYSRRTTADNVDLNRNAVEFDRALPVNERYRELHPLLVPASWPPSPDIEQALAAAMQRMGFAQFQDAVTRGQYEFPDGLFYGGQVPTWSHRVFRAWLRERARHLRSVAWIDLHTGLGPCAKAEPIFTGGSTESAWDLARQWWGEVTRAGDGTSASAELCGTLAAIVHEELGGRLATSITLEFGTVPPLQVLAALRADAWLHGVGARHVGPGMRRSVAETMRRAFYIEDHAWTTAVFEQSMSAIGAGVLGLARLRDEYDRPPQRTSSAVAAAFQLTGTQASPT